MASAHVKSITFAVAASLNLVLLEGTALAKTKGSEQKLGQAQGATQQGVDLTTKQIQALESVID